MRLHETFPTGKNRYWLYYWNFRRMYLSQHDSIEDALYEFACMIDDDHTYSGAPIGIYDSVNKEWVYGEENKIKDVDVDKLNPDKDEVNPDYY